jgi:hypothetical protein
MVAGHEDHLSSLAEARSDRPQYGLGHVHRLLRAALQQLDNIPQQNQPLDTLERTEQRLERLGAAQHIALQARAEMEI